MLPLNIFMLFSLISTICGQVMHKRFEYKYSFKGPYLAQKDNQVPFWSYSGHAIASEESFRITPSLRSQKGQAWTKNAINFEWWEIEMVFRVNGRGRIGADGLAFWYSQRPGVEGPVFGSSDMWVGLGLFFDSFDNDNKRNNPYVMAMVNDGTKAYDHEHDGMSQQLGGCLRDFRNKPFPIRAKIEYYRNVLTVMVNNGMNDNEKDYEICMRAENVFLPAGGHFGLTAATGGLADDHDVLKFLVSSLRSSEEMAQIRLSQEEEDKFQKEFQQYQDKTNKARDEYIAEHPDSKPRDQQQEYDTNEQRELRQIFQGQGQIFEVIKQLHGKLDEVIGRQERTLSLVSGGSYTPPPAQVGGQPSVGGQMQRHEVDALLSQQRDIAQGTRDIKAYVMDVQQKSQILVANSQKATGSVQQPGFDMHVTLKEINEGINILKRDLGVANHRLGAGTGASVPACPNVSCASIPVLLTFMVAQVIVLLGYFVYRDSKEAQAKKFY